MLLLSHGLCRNEIRALRRDHVPAAYHGQTLRFRRGDQAQIKLEPDGAPLPELPAVLTAAGCLQIN